MALGCAAGGDGGGRGATLPLFLRSLIVCTNALVRSLSSFATPWRQQPGEQRFFAAAMQEQSGRPARGYERLSNRHTAMNSARAERDGSGQSVTGPGTINGRAQRTVGSEARGMVPAADRARLVVRGALLVMYDRREVAHHHHARRDAARHGDKALLAGVRGAR